jgi:hypothetical protein
MPKVDAEDSLIGVRQRKLIELHQGVLASMDNVPNIPPVLLVALDETPNIPSPPVGANSR